MPVIDNIRKEFLAALKDTHYESAELWQTLDSAAAHTADLWQPHEDEDPTTAVDGTRTNWTPKYFSRQAFLAERNFSKERVTHLIEVRQFLRERGDKGFVPGAKSRPQKVSVSEKSGTYNPPEVLAKFVNEGDLMSARTALRLELNDNRLDSFELENASHWVKSHFPDFYEPFIEKEFARGFDPDEGNWTPDYYGKQQVFLKANFSEKRFLHLVEVRGHLRARKAKGFKSIVPSATSRTPSVRREASHTMPASTDPERNPALKAVFLLGGAFAVVVVLILSLIK
tara:strand:+ start:13624 stop:14475 length:852 start_codon:yes stop_codon:yes gene_type:complete